MPIDAMTLAAVGDELEILVRGGRIDTIISPTEHAVALQCYAPPRSAGEGGHNRWLYLSAHPQLARVHVTALKPPKIASDPPAFVMLLRKYLEGARIEAIVQPRWERVLEIVAGHRLAPNSEERTRYRLIIEVMGRLSNIIFCDEQGLILGSLRRVGSEVNRYRTIAANVQYVPPPPQTRTLGGQLLAKLEPTTVSAAHLRLCAADDEMAAREPGRAQKGRKRAVEEPKLWSLLTRHLLGFSPLLARESVYRTTRDAETVAIGAVGGDDTWEELAWNVRELANLYETRRWQPQIVERVAENGETQAPSSAVPLDVTPYTLEQYAEKADIRVRHSPSINVLLDEYYARTEWRDAMEGVRNPLRKLLQTQRERCLRKGELLQEELAKSAEAAQYRFHADLLIAHQQEIVQGESSVRLENFFTNDDAESEPMVTIALDPRYDAVGNANRLYNKYHKLRRATAQVPAQIEQNAAELATIEQMLADLMLADTTAEVALVRAEVQAAGYVRGSQKQQEKKTQQTAKKGKGGKSGKGKPTAPGGGVPLHMQSRDGFTVLIGKNSRQNEEVTFHQATANDMWLHARGVPGAHVIIKAAGRDIPRSTIEQAASLAAFYSQSRGSTTAPVDYTLQKHVRHMKGGGPGMVIYERERTIYVPPVGNT